MLPRETWKRVIIALGIAYLLFALAFWSYEVVVEHEPLFGDPGPRPITYVNNTDEPLQFEAAYVDGRFWEEGIVAPHSTHTGQEVLCARGYHIVATRLDGRKAFDQTYRWGQLVDSGFAVTVPPSRPP
jgi:hypothetical protein